MGLGSEFQNVVEFNIEAISVPIVYNNYGDNDPNGMLYALKEDVSAIQADAIARFNMYPPQTSSKVVPLVIRCHLGDVLKINFHNSVNTRASIHVEGLNYNVLTSDGASEGYNPDTTTSDTISYLWFADHEGTYLFSDLADPRSGEFTNIHGLFGAVIVEAPGSRWLDPVTGRALKTGLFADIYSPKRKAFREYTVFFQDELAVKDKDGNAPIDPHTGMESSTMGISYRSEPMRHRMVDPPHMLPKDAKCVTNVYPQGTISDMEPMDPGHMEHVLTGEDVGMSSWYFGDPATFLLNAYVGDPCIIKLLHAGVKETHVMHIHNHQWRLEPNNPTSIIIDSQSISPQEVYEIDILYGAGSLTGTIGDVIWHCHLYPHFMEGMWGLWRIHDRLEDGTGRLPDGTPIPALMPLKDRPLPPRKDDNHPGYPNFINSTPGQRPKQPPLGIINPDGTIKTIPTQLERDNFVAGALPGALYSRTCPDSPPCSPDKVFEIAVVQADIEYNSFGWHDPQGRFMVLRQEVEKYGNLERYLELVKQKRIQVEPLVIRANAGDCIEIRFTNMLPLYIKESAFDPLTLTDIVGFHIHLVKFDTISADGSANGWCNMAGAFQCETLIERFYANEELHTVFFHDHLYPNSHQQHGLFGALIVEPAGSCFYDMTTREPLFYGTRAIIQREDCTEYREYVLAIHDFAYLFDRNGKPINPPDIAGSHDDPGVMGINYRCEPFVERLKNPQSDPAYIFSSRVHGDPATPLLETYEGDEVMIRLFQGAQEEQHCFNVVGMKWNKEHLNRLSPISSSQTLGISEVFNISIRRDYNYGDYLYHFGGIDDIWLGAWGIIRVYRNLNEKIAAITNACSVRRKALRLPRNARVRKYEIAAVQTPIQYN